MEQLLQEHLNLKPFKTFVFEKQENAKTQIQIVRAPIQQ
jgi:hypothetical protein